MEIFVSELPKSCDGCCFNNDSYCVNNEYVIENYFTQTKHPNCPLKPLSEALMKERKKVVQEIKKLVIESTCYDTEEEVRNHLYDMSASEVLELLDQIERGE